MKTTDLKVQSLSYAPILQPLALALVGVHGPERGIVNVREIKSRSVVKDTDKSIPPPRTLQLPAAEPRRQSLSAKVLTLPSVPLILSKSGAALLTLMFPLPLGVVNCVPVQPAPVQKLPVAAQILFIARIPPLLFW